MNNDGAGFAALSAGNLDALIATRFTFFTGKGGVGKTSLACACAVTLADRGRRVLLVSTDPASNLDETFGIALGNVPLAVPGVANLSAMNIDPEQAAEDYRARVIGPLTGHASSEDIAGLREQLSGACTTEIAAFDEFAALLGDAAAATRYDCVLFDTAPTGHTLRLLSLPKAWTSFFDINERGASCLGPHSALKNQQARFEQAFANLANPALSAVVLVARADAGAIAEAARTAGELATLGLTRHALVMNAVFRAAVGDDALAASLQAATERRLASLPPALAAMPRFLVPLRPFNSVGLAAIRAFLQPDMDNVHGNDTPVAAPQPTWSLHAFVDELAARKHGLVLVMGKGGVGKTTVAAALAVALARRGVDVHLSTTDPAAHVAGTLDGTLANLRVSRIDPAAEAAAYTEKVMRSKGGGMDEDARQLLREDLASPCTQEVAVFHAFSHIVMESRRAVVILDTAPTGHTLLLLDAAGSYHREMMRKTTGFGGGKVVTPLMQLKNPAVSSIVLVALPETTPVSEAAALQDDLRRAGVEPTGWIINRSLAAAGVSDPVLRRRARLELSEIARVQAALAARVAILPWQAEEPVGLERLSALVDG